ncbi:hypothetical protein BB8028_0006g06060 [Beauveria bassiana]|uniref:F-box domain-containing protein n=1 Tax=Beauveria bassiana TaxID=176275 RepID=A0A2S7YJE5_BEABA|nr:hypothetical protein BB8028_0006g06060 [Beauveria bassiana]
MDLVELNPHPSHGSVNNDTQRILPNSFADILPTELIEHIADYLPFTAIYHLRICCKRLAITLKRHLCAAARLASDEEILECLTASVFNMADQWAYGACLCLHKYLYADIPQQFFGEVMRPCPRLSIP